MGIIEYRRDQAEKRDEASAARIGRIDDTLSDVAVTLAGLATRDSMGNWGLPVIALVLATGLGIAAVLLQSSGNQLAALQPGLSAIQAVSSAHDLAPATPAAPPQKH